MAERSPDFRAPPVIERVLGVQFDPIPSLSNAHLGAFWCTLGDDWPKVNDAAPMPQEFERFGKDQIWMRLGETRLNITTAPAARVQIRNRAENRMIQLQNGRFYYNWIGKAGIPYERYPVIRGEFLQMVGQFRQFLDQRLATSLHANQWEIAYVNQLPVGTVWKTPSDWNEVFASPIALPTQLPNSRLEGFDCEWRYEIGSQRGRLRIELRHGREERDPSRELLVFNLMTRGRVDPDRDGWDLASGLDLGHDTIVNSFTQLTSDRARRIWEEYR